MTSVRRRSAFVIFQAIKPLLNAGKLLTGDGSKATITKPLLASAGNKTAAITTHNMATRDMYEPDASPELANNQNTTNLGRSQKTAKTVQTRKTSKCCDSMKTRSNREKLQQEKEDFQLAKMLQECVGTSDAPSRYSLRSRNKSSVSSLSSTSSSQEQIYHSSRGFAVGATPKFKKTMPFSNNTKDLTVSRASLRNADPSEKFIDFSFQKLTRSRRIAMTMSGV